MAATPATRATFIASVVSWTSKYSLDGVAIDCELSVRVHAAPCLSTGLTRLRPGVPFAGEYPCSPPRTNPVEISCSEFQNVADAGGNCPADTNNSVALMQELRAALPPGSIIAVDSQAAKVNSDEEGVKFMWPYIDYFRACGVCGWRRVCATLHPRPLRAPL